jgi:hypothetical protein
VAESDLPHLAQVRASGAAHSSQNFAPDGFSCWQREHRMGLAPELVNAVMKSPCFVGAETTFSL